MQAEIFNLIEPKCYMGNLACPNGHIGSVLLFDFPCLIYRNPLVSSYGDGLKFPSKCYMGNFTIPKGHIGSALLDFMSWSDGLKFPSKCYM